MDIASIDIINSMGNSNIFKINVYDVSCQIKSEVPMFRQLLINNLYNTDVFYTIVNNINVAWNSILNDSFKILISKYNKVYQKEIDLRNRMIQFSNRFNADNLSLSELSIGPPKMSHLIKKLEKTKIKKRPSRRK